MRRDSSSLAPLVGIIPAFTLLFIYVYCPIFPYPDDNVDGRVLADFVRARSAGEAMGIAAFLTAAFLFIFLMVITSKYREGRKDTTASRRVISCVSAANLALWAVASAVFTSMAMLADGYPNIGRSQSNLVIITTLWDLDNVLFTFSFPLLAIAAIAVIVANRACPILPPSLGVWGAAAVAAVNVLSVGTLFIHTGKWSAGSIYGFGVTAGISYLWVALSAIALTLRSRRSGSQEFTGSPPASYISAK